MTVPLPFMKDTLKGGENREKRATANYIQTQTQALFPSDLALQSGCSLLHWETFRGIRKGQKKG